MWQSEAQKKYSFALYLSNELSKAEAATLKRNMTFFWLRDILKTFIALI